MSWYETLIEKAQELGRIADWASGVGYGAVRDHCRAAAHELRELAADSIRVAGTGNFPEHD